MRKIVLASDNSGKLRELQAVLKSLPVIIVPQAEFSISTPEETGLSFVENALIKARYASQQTGLPAISDDSGLEVDALQGKPGIYSSRSAGDQASDADNIKQLLAALKDVPEEQRTACFQCVLVLMRQANDPTPLIYQGSWQGRILLSPQGESGFGYDPVFYVPSHQCSAAQLKSAEKNRISHRGQALKKLKAFLK